MSLREDRTRRESAYERARRLAFNGDDATRAALAAEPGTAPEILYYLSEDPTQAVRQAVAANATSPPQADRRLAHDASTEVRTLLGRKLALVAPHLSDHEHDRLRRLSWEALCDLAADTAVAVRAAIADALAEMPDAPHSLVLALARDVEMSVAEPVIRLSPMLTEEDLLALVSLPPVPATVAAVARRPSLSEVISDAIVAGADAPTVAVLLENPSAAIRESTLDYLIAQAAQHGEWHQGLVQRPSLTPRAAWAMR